jgi:glycosyltransferase involved in cell wall biosynthesis
MSVYNGEPYVSAAVESILSQSLCDFEFIIVDDGSTDRTPELLQGFAQRDPRVRLIRNVRNEGYTRSLNTGLVHARGDIIARQDADDVSAVDRLATQLALLEQRGEVGVVGILPVFIDATGAVIAWPDLERLPTTNDRIQAYLLDQNCLWHGSVVFRRSLLTQVGSYNPSLEPSEDYDLWLRMAEVCEIVNLPEPLYRYRHHEASVSSTRRAEQMLNKAIALDNALRRRPRSALQDEGQRLLARDYFRAALRFFAIRHENAAMCLSRACSVQPRLMDDVALVEDVIRRSIRRMRGISAIDFVQVLFEELLPHSRRLAHLKRRLLAELHIDRALAIRPEGGTQWRKHLWLGVQANPGWLANRGVLALLIRDTFQ